MQVSNQIDHLIQALNDLRPLLSNDKQTNTNKFAELLKTSLEQSTGKNYFAEELVTSKIRKKAPTYLIGSIQITPSPKT